MTALPADFVLPVDKPEGPTSHDVVRAARQGLGNRRVGHTGTLDPFASGLLLLCVGKATRLAEYLSGLGKTYEAVAHLGRSTDTLDREGVVVEERGGWADLEEEQIRDVLAGFRGALEQIPPQFSAKKVGGVAMHRRARRGETIPLSPSSVTVHSIELTSVELPLLGFEVTCSSGTYVRSLARDIGEALGCGAHLASLRRTEIGEFRVEEALGVHEMGDRSRVAEVALDPLTALGHLPRLDVDEDAARRLAQGQTVPIADTGIRTQLAVTHAGALLAIGESRGGVLRPRKVFAA